MKLLDANYVLRFILNDNEEMTLQAKTVIFSNIVHISDAVFAEVVYVLSKVYKIERKDIAKCMLKLTEIRNIQTQNKSVIKKCMEYYSDTALDFVDCLLAAYHSAEGYEICTFDKKLRKLMERIEDN